MRPIKIKEYIRRIPNENNAKWDKMRGEGPYDVAQMSGYFGLNWLYFLN